MAQQVEQVLNSKPSFITTKHPSVRVMERWMDKGIAKATDGCKVEPDGHCPHGCPSWLLELGVI